MPEEVSYIIRQLSAAGYAAYCVGGCVRDSLLGKEPDDWDITTSSPPMEIKRLFRHTIDTGLKHGTVTVLIYPDDSEVYSETVTEKKEIKKAEPAKDRPACFEVTTYRIDGAYTDGRHPEEVTFTDDLAEDLRRRDFTINAMAYNEEAGLIDLFGGREDLRSGLIRCVGVPDERFDEDALRILRAIRFSAQLGFSIEQRTAAAITRHASSLDLISRERIYVELNKLLCSAHMERLQDLFTLGLSDHIAEGFQHALPLGPGTAAPLDPEHPDLTLPALSTEKRYQRYALTFRGLSEETVRSFLRALKSDTATEKDAGFAAPLLLSVLPSDPLAFKKLIARTDLKHFKELLEMKKSISKTEEYCRFCAGEDIDALIRLFDGIVSRDEPIYMKDLIVTGNDLIQAGVKRGEDIGKILNVMLDDVRRNPANNSVLYLFSKYLG